MAIQDEPNIVHIKLEHNYWFMKILVDIQSLSEHVLLLRFISLVGMSSFNMESSILNYISSHLCRKLLEKTGKCSFPTGGSPLLNSTKKSRAFCKYVSTVKYISKCWINKMVIDTSLFLYICLLWKCPYMADTDLPVTCTKS